MISPARAESMQETGTANTIVPTDLPTISIELADADPLESVTPIETKTEFLKRLPSHRAVDLGKLTDVTLFEAERSHFSSTNQEWIVAAEQIPKLDAVPPSRPSDRPLSKSSPTPVQSSELPVAPGLTIATDPSSPTPPPVFTCPTPDPELGCLRLQNPIFPTAPPPILYLIPRIDFFRSNNLLLGIDPINDGLIRPTLTLLAVPPLGPDTYILASVEGAFNRYFEVPVFNYDELRIRAGLLQRLSPSMTAEIGWTNQQLFIASNEIRGFPYGRRFLNDQAVRFELSRRDQLNDRLFLNSIYQFRVGFSEPEDRSRILNVLFLSLNYDLNPSRTIQLGVDYQFSAANYTFVRRTDIYQQLLGRITFSAFRNSQLSVYSGISFGDSTERGIDFNSFVLGVSVSVNIVLF